MRKPKARSFGRWEASKQPTPKAHKQTSPTSLEGMGQVKPKQKVLDIFPSQKASPAMPRTETNRQGNLSSEAYMPGTEEGRSSRVSATGCGDKPARPQGGNNAKAAPLGFTEEFASSRRRVCIYIYIYIYVCLYIHIYIYIR